MRVEDQSDLMPAVAAAGFGQPASAGRASAADQSRSKGAASSQPAVSSGASVGSQRARGLALRRRDFVLIAAMLAVAAIFAVILIHGPGPVKGPGDVAAAKSTVYDGLAMPTPWRVAPPTALHNYLGTPVNIDAYKGRAVLVTFLYVHCPNVCPIITSKLHTALQAMSATERKEVQIVAISVDPRGDTPSTVAQFLAEHEMTGRMQYLLGTEKSLFPIWKEWDVASTPESDPDLIAHTALVYGVTATGKIATIYPSSFSPSQIVHDVPLLART
jgi:protein SCO1/2